MKLSILIIFMILLMPLSLAELRISLISYQAETQEAKILVANVGQTDYTDISFSFDDSSTEFKGSILRPHTGFTVPKIVSPGLHTVTVLTKEGEFSQKLLFARTAEVTPENFRIKGQEPVAIPVEPTPPQGRGVWFYILLILVIIAILAGAGYVYFRFHPDQWQKVVGKWRALLANLGIKKEAPNKPIYRAPIQTYVARKPMVSTTRKVQRAAVFEKFGGKK